MLIMEMLRLMMFLFKFEYDICLNMFILLSLMFENLLIVYMGMYM